MLNKKNDVIYLKSSVVFLHNYTMKKLTTVIIILLVVLPVTNFAQSAGNAKTNLAGKWLLVKHTLTEKGKVDDLLTPNEIYTFDFAPGGSYAVSYTNKKNESTTVYRGKWKFVNNGKQLNLYDNNTVPVDPKTLVGNKQLPVIRLTSKEFVTKELLFGMDLLGTSYYKKQ